MLGSFTRYHAMNDPATVKVTAAAASGVGKKSRASR